MAYKWTLIMFPFSLFKKKKKLEDLPQENVQNFSQQPQFNEQDNSHELINSKLDTINAKLDNMNMRLKKIEELANQ
jgi:hypothetical protein